MPRKPTLQQSFLPSERLELKSCEVTEEQIKELETALPYLGKYVEETIRKTEVRRQVLTVRTHLARALRVYEGLERRIRKSGARLEDHVALFTYLVRDNDDQVTVDRLRKLVDRYEASISEISSIPQSHYRAPPEPISHIADALAWPVDRIKDSGKFLRVAKVCYAKAGLSDDPRRAIQRYLEARHKGQGFFLLVAAPAETEPKPLDG